MNIGKCPKCNSNIEIREKIIKNKKVELYACENAKWCTEDGEFFELTKSSTCDFKIWQNSLSKFGYPRLKHSEIKSLLNNEDIIISLKNKQSKKNYKKYATLNLEYGVSILFDIDVEED